MNNPALILIILANCLSFYYLLVWLPRPDSQNRSLLKIAPMVLLIAATPFAAISPIIVFGLVACLIGDYFLSMEGDKNFIAGLTAFLVGHLFYIGFFANGFDFSFFSLPQSQETLLVLLALVALVLFRLWPYLGEMKIPVILYSCTILAMAYFARMAQPGLIVLAGVVLFVISDIILANDKFTPLTRSLPRRLMPYAVWLFYFTGQSLIVAGMIFPEFNFT